jgi:hypothetical protein
MILWEQCGIKPALGKTMAKVEQRQVVPDCIVLLFTRNGLMYGSMILRAAILSTAPSAPVLLLGLLLLTSP